MAGGADITSWILRSPRRLAVIAILAIGGVLAIGNLTHGSAQPAAAPSATPTATAPPASVAAQVPDAQPFVATAVHFVQEWARIRPGESAAQWQRRLAPLATDELAAALRLTDPSSLPDAAPSGEPNVRFVAQSSALVAVPLSTGATVLVTVIDTPGGGWRVSDIQPDTGDVGDVSGSQNSATASSTSRSTASSTSSRGGQP
jgi:hypothetical protein